MESLRALGSQREHQRHRLVRSDYRLISQAQKKLKITVIHKVTSGLNYQLCAHARQQSRY